MDTETVSGGRQAPFIKDKSTGQSVSVNTTVQEKLALVENSLKNRPNDLELLVQKGQHLVGLKRYDEALSVLDTAISLNANYADAWSVRSWALYGLKQFDDALISINKALQLKPNTPWYTLNKKVITDATAGRPASNPRFFTR